MGETGSGSFAPFAAQLDKITNQRVFWETKMRIVHQIVQFFLKLIEDNEIVWRRKSELHGNRPILFAEFSYPDGNGIQRTIPVSIKIQTDVCFFPAKPYYLLELFIDDQGISVVFEGRLKTKNDPDPTSSLRYNQEVYLLGERLFEH